MPSTAKGTYRMLGNESLWQAAEATHAELTNANVAHALLGGVAVCLHGYQRNTVDIDLLVCSQDAERLRNTLEQTGWSWNPNAKQFEAESGVILQFLIAGERAGRGAEVRLPDPSDPSVISYLEGLPVLTLARLIESKIASGQGDARRMYKDYADVVELIAMHNLHRSFERKLHPSLRPSFRELVDRARSS